MHTIAIYYTIEPPGPGSGRGGEEEDRKHQLKPREGAGNALVEHVDRWSQRAMERAQVMRGSVKHSSVGQVGGVGTPRRGQQAEGGV